MTDVCTVRVTDKSALAVGFAEAGADIITIHAEAGPHLHRSLRVLQFPAPFLIGGEITKGLPRGEANLICKGCEARPQQCAEATRRTGDQNAFILRHDLLHLSDRGLDPRNRLCQHVGAGGGRDAKIG